MNSQDLQIDWLKCFVAVVDTGSITRAAPLIHRSQAAVSMQIKKLESATGSQLFHRGAKHVQLTPDGQKLLGYARRILDIHAEAYSAFNPEQLTGIIRLGVPDDYAQKYITPVLQQFAVQHSGIEIELTCEQSTKLIPKVDAGELDLALVSRDQQQGTFLFDEPMEWVGSHHFDVWKKDPLPIAVYEEVSLARQAVITSLAQQGRQYRVVYHSSSLAGQIAAVESGLAVAVLTQACIPPHLRRLGHKEGLGPLISMEVAAYRSPKSLEKSTVDRLYNMMISTLRRPL
jgi:DNA-binding transcriptional LysR family regulator